MNEFIHEKHLEPHQASSEHRLALIIINSDRTSREVTFPMMLGVLFVKAPPRIMSSFSKTLGSFSPLQAKRPFSRQKNP